MKTLINLMALTALAAAGARADSISITLDDANQTGIPGGTLQFFGEITNTSSDTDPADAIYLNGDSFNFGLDAADYTLFDDFANLPVFLTGGESSGDIDLFDITLAAKPKAGLYSGTYDLIGGMDGGNGSGQDYLETPPGVSFSVDVELPAPEPATFALLGTGLVLIGLRKCRNRKRGAPMSVASIIPL